MGREGGGESQEMLPLEYLHIHGRVGGEGQEMLPLEYLHIHGRVGGEGQEMLPLEYLHIHGRAGGGGSGHASTFRKLTSHLPPSFHSILLSEPGLKYSPFYPLKL